MNGQLTYQDYKGFFTKMKYANHFSDYHEQVRMMKNFDRLFDSMEIVEFYPKNCFIREALTSLYVFTENKLVKISEYDKRVKFDVFNYNDIQTLNLETQDYYGSGRSALNIQFSNGEQVYLNSNEDTGDDWEDTFEDKIVKIFNFLLTK